MKFVVGALFIVMSIIHVVYGEKMQVPELKKLQANEVMIGSVRAMSLQGGFVLFFVGLLEILLFMDVIVLTGLAKWIPMSIVVLNIVAVLIVAIFKHRILLRVTVPQFVIFIILLVLQWISV